MVGGNDPIVSRKLWISMVIEKRHKSEGVEGESWNCGISELSAEPSSWRAIGT